MHVVFNMPLKGLLSLELSFINTLRYLLVVVLMLFFFIKNYNNLQLSPILNLGKNYLEVINEKVNRNSYDDVIS